MAQFRTLDAAAVQEILRGFGPGRVRRASTDPRGDHQHQRAGGGRGGPAVPAHQRGQVRGRRPSRSRDRVARGRARGAHPRTIRHTCGRVFRALGRRAGFVVSLVPRRTLTRAELTPVHAAAAGDALARLHRASEGFADHRPSRYEPPEIARRLAEVGQLGRPELGAAVAALEPELDRLERERAAELPNGIIHGDLFIDNVLYDGDALSALLDFEQASWGRFAYDLAVTTLAFGYGREDFRSEVVRALIDAYARVRPPTSDERAAFGAELRFVACRFAVTRSPTYISNGRRAPRRESASSATSNGSRASDGIWTPGTDCSRSEAQHDGPKARYRLSGM